MKPKWKIKDIIHPMHPNWIDVYESWGWTYPEFCQMAKWSRMTPCEYVDFFNEHFVPELWYEIYPDFDLPNPHLHLKDTLPKQYHKLVDDLNIQNTKALIERKNTQTSFDFSFWQEIYHKEYVADTRIQLYLKYKETGLSQHYNQSHLYVYDKNIDTYNHKRLRELYELKKQRDFAAADALKKMFTGFILYEGREFSELILDDRFYYVKEERTP